MYFFIMDNKNAMIQWITTKVLGSDQILISLYFGIFLCQWKKKHIFLCQWKKKHNWKLDLWNLNIRFSLNHDFKTHHNYNHTVKNHYSFQSFFSCCNFSCINNYFLTNFHNKLQPQFILRLQIIAGISRIGFWGKNTQYISMIGCLSQVGLGGIPHVI